MMKKNLNTLVVCAHFAAIALIALLTACSVDDSTAEQPAQQTGQETETVEYTVSIPTTIGDTDGTRAVSLNGETGGLDATFQTADNIYAYNQSMQLMARKSSQSCVLHPDAEGPAADLTGKIAFYQSLTIPSTPRLNQWLLLMYKLNANANSDNPVFNYTGQKGTLEDVSRFDFATAEVKITGLSGNQGGYNVTTSNANFQNLQSMFRFNFSGLLSGDAIASVKIHSAKVKLVLNYRPINRSSYNGDMTINLDDAARNANGTGVVYAALRFAELKKDETDDITFTVTSTNGHIYTATKKTPKGGFQNGKFYRASLALSPTTVKLAALTADFTATDGQTLTGTLKANVKISIASGSTVTLDGVTINGVDDEAYKWAGISCLGDAVIVLANGSENTVCGFNLSYPGIHIPKDKTLTIKGSTGKLAAYGNSYSGFVGSGFAAGIGGGSDLDCGNIRIEGGDITARSGGGAAIGSGGYDDELDQFAPTCGNITITGGKIHAEQAALGGAGAGIGSGIFSSCGDITIEGGEITTRTSDGAGIGSGASGSCGDIVVKGGSINAGNVALGPCLGAGAAYGYYPGTCGNVTITADITRVYVNHRKGGFPFLTLHGDPELCGTLTFGNKVVEKDTWIYDFPYGETLFGGLKVIHREGGDWELTPAVEP